jgi:hypothetical protein
MCVRPLPRQGPARARRGIAKKAQGVHRRARVPAVTAQRLTETCVCCAGGEAEGEVGTSGRADGTRQGHGWRARDQQTAGVFDSVDRVVTELWRAAAGQEEGDAAPGAEAAAAATPAAAVDPQTLRMLGAIAREAASAYRQPAKLSKGRSVAWRAVTKAVQAAAKAPAAKAVEKCWATIRRMRAKTVRCTACVLACR